MSRLACVCGGIRAFDRSLTAMLRMLPLIRSAVVTTSGCERECSFVWRDISADGRFEIELCRISDHSTRMPGQSSDAPGKVILRERPSGRALRSEFTSS